MKHLRAKVQKTNYWYIRKDDFYIKEVVSIPISLAEIADSVAQPVNLDLQEKILTGMLFPVIVVDNTPEEYKLAVANLSNALPYDSTKKYLNIIGNQRTTIARHSNYDLIDCYVADSGIESLSIKFAYEEEYHGRL